MGGGATAPAAARQLRRRDGRDGRVGLRGLGGPAAVLCVCGRGFN